MYVIARGSRALGQYEPCLLLTYMLVSFRLARADVVWNKNTICQASHLWLGLQVASELGDAIQVLKLDVDQNTELSTRLQVCVFVNAHHCSACDDCSAVRG